jgi:hypothetical protein
MTGYKVRDLQQMCRERGIKGFSRKKKSQLLEMLGMESSRQGKLDKVVRDVYDALFPEDSKRMETRFFTRLKNELEKVLEEHPFIILERVGTEFLLSNGKRLSIRGSLQSEYIYPDQIGKLLLKEFEEQLAIPEVDPSEAGGRPLDAKSWIIDHIHILLPRYLEQTVGDYLLWIDEKTSKCRLFNNPRDLFFRDLTFSRRPDQWKSKNSVRTGKMLLGDFIFTDERVEFRFKTSTLIRLLQS